MAGTGAPAAARRQGRRRAAPAARRRRRAGGLVAVGHRAVRDHRCWCSASRWRDCHSAALPLSPAEQVFQWGWRESVSIMTVLPTGRQRAERELCRHLRGQHRGRQRVVRGPRLQFRKPDALNHPLIGVPHSNLGPPRRQFAGIRYGAAFASGAAVAEIGTALHLLFAWPHAWPGCALFASMRTHRLAVT